MELNRNNLKKPILLIAFGVILYWLLNHLDLVGTVVKTGVVVASPFILGLCFAFIVNVPLKMFEQLWDKLWGGVKKKNSYISKIKRPVCFIVTLVAIAAVIFIILFMIIPELYRTIQTIIDMFPWYLEQFEKWWNVIAGEMIEKGVELPELDINWQQVGTTVGSFLTKSALSVFDTTVAITTSIFNGIVNAALGFVFSIYVLMNKETLCRQCRDVLFAFVEKKRAETVISVIELTNKTFTKFVTGQFTEAIIIGLLCFVGMSILSIPYATMVSVLVGFTALIPVVGAFLGTAVGVFLIFTVAPIKAVWFLIFIIVLQQLEGNLIYPRVVGKSVGLPGMWVLVAVTIGGSISGVVGMLISVPLCSVLYTLFRSVVYRRLKDKACYKHS